MSIKFHSRTNTKSSGTANINLGLGDLQSGGVVLQGFHMSYGIDKSYEVESLEAWLGNVTFESEDGNIICKYDYRCGMKGDEVFGEDEHEATTLSTRALVIAEIE